MNARRFLSIQVFVGIWLVVLAIFGLPALGAAPSTGQQPGGHLTITNVFVDFDDNLITIVGESFDFGAPLKITLGSQDDVGDITSLCTPNFSTVPQTITCDFSADGLPPAGDYRLIVSTGIGQSQADQYDLTIGAVGPKGETGQQGPPGNLGLAGQRCPEGQYVVGFNALGNIECSGGGGGPTACANKQYTFNMQSSSGSTFTGAKWPGGSQTQSDPTNPGCSVTAVLPSGNVSVTGLLGNHWYVSSKTGYSNCFGVGGEDGDGVATPNCHSLTLSFGYVQDGRPSCTSSVCTFCSGRAYDSYYVQCLQ